MLEAQQQRNILELCEMTGNDNSELLTLMIPENEMHMHKYYEFSDLIYYINDDDKESVRIVDIIIKEIKKGIKNVNFMDNEIQIVVPYIKKEWLTN